MDLLDIFHGYQILFNDYLFKTNQHLNKNSNSYSFLYYIDNT